MDESDLQKLEAGEFRLGVDLILTGDRRGSSRSGLPPIMPVGAFPFDDGRDLAWRATVDGWLRRLGEHLFSTVRFRLGLVGWTDGLDDGTEDLLERGVPKERWVGYLVPSGDSLTWYPPNQGAPMRAGHP